MSTRHVVSSIPWLVLLGFGAFLAAASPEAGAQERAGTPGQEWDGGSALPCDVPLRWRIDEMDERFGLTPQEAEDAVRLAGMLWENAVDRVLFARDPERGFPIHFAYDERQETSRERIRAQAEMDEASREIREARRALEARTEEVVGTRSEYERRLRVYTDRLERHRERLEEWRRRGGPPEAERARLEEVGDALDRERAQLDAMAEEVNRLVDRLNSETEEFNRRVAEHNRASAEFRERFPASVIQSGTYRESRRTVAGRVVSAEREIRIYHYEDWNHLVMVLAHELGHALGLGHTGVAGSIMVDAAGPRSEGGRTPRLTPSDLELLRERCPDL